MYIKLTSIIIFFYHYKVLSNYSLCPSWHIKFTTTQFSKVTWLQQYLGNKRIRIIWKLNVWPKETLLTKQTHLQAFPMWQRLMHNTVCEVMEAGIIIIDRSVYLLQMWSFIKWMASNDILATCTTAFYKLGSQCLWNVSSLTSVLLHPQDINNNHTKIRAK